MRAPAPSLPYARSQGQQSKRVIVRTTADLTHALIDECTLVSDLTRGSWRAHTLLNELRAQLPAELRSCAAPNARVSQGRFGFAEAAAQGIDAECLGDRSIEYGVQLGVALLRLARLRGAVRVLVLCSKQVLVAEEDRRLLTSMVTMLRSSVVEVTEVLVEADASGVDNPWPLGRIVPGILDPETLALLHPPSHVMAALVDLPEGQKLLPLEWSASATRASRFEFDSLAVLPDLPAWIRAYAQVFGNHHFADPEFLIHQAWAAFAGGGKQLAFTLLGRALEVGRDTVDRGTTMCHLQGMRIADLRFVEAAEEQLPSPGLVTSVRAFLLVAKGWGCVLDGRAAEGEVLLEQANALGAYPVGTAEYYYLANIRALARFRQGDITGALGLEREIAHALSISTDSHGQLAYVNALNLARIHTVRDAHQDAFCEYTRAFDTARGAWVESDLLYSCVCLARCAEADGDVRQARRKWLKAALYWVTNPAKQAVSRRIARIITGSQWTDAQTAAESISRVLTGNLERLGFSGSTFDGPTIMRVWSRDDLESEASMHGVDDLYVLSMNSSVPNEMGDGDESSSALRRAIAVAVFSHFGEPFGDPTLTIGVPVRVGFGLPSSASDALAQCLRLGVGQAQFDHCAVDLGPERYADLEAKLVFRLNPNVVGLDGDRYCLEARFRRYQDPRTLRGWDAELVDAARSPRLVLPLAERIGIAPHELLRQLRRLEAEGLLDVGFVET